MRHNGSIQRPLDAGSIAVDLPSLPAIRRLVEHSARRCGLAEQRVRDAVLAANELATNVIRHGGGSGRLWLWSVGRTLCCQVADQGPGLIDIGRLGAPPADPSRLTGRGLWLVRQLCEDVHVATGATGTVITFAVNGALTAAA